MRFLLVRPVGHSEPFRGANQDSPNFNTPSDCPHHPFGTRSGAERNSAGWRAATQVLYGGMGRLSENSVLNLKNKSHAVTAEVVIPAGGGQGVMIAQGGAFAGWSVYLHDGKPKYCHNLAGLQRFYAEADSAVPASTRCRWSSPTTAAAGQGRAGHPLGRRRQGRRGPGRGDGADDLLRRRDLRRRLRLRHPVSEDYTSADGSFKGKVKWVQLDAALDDHDRLITPEERFRVAMAIQ